MAKSIDFLNNITINFNSNLFSSAAKANNWHTATESLCRALSFVLDMAMRLNNYEREDATCSTYNGLYGADELCFNLSLANRRTYKNTTTGTTSSNYYTASGGFYLTAQQMATKMWGLSTTELPTSQFLSAPPEKNYSLYNQDYNSLISALESLNVPVADYWKLSRVIPAGLSSGTSFVVYDPTSYFYHKTLRAGTTTSFTGYKVHNFFSAIYNIRGHARILKVIMDNTPTGSRGGRTFPSSYSLRDCLYSLPQFQPHEIVRIRQALTKVRAQIATQGYNISNPGTRIRARIKNMLTGYGINFSTAELSDYTTDPTDYYARATKINDPLIIAAAGFALIQQEDTINTQYWWDSLVPAVHICRKYLTRRWAVAYDYKEETNPNAFEKAGGKVDYRKSNMRVWLNSRSTSPTAWKVPTHDYDAYYSTGQYPYLQTLSSTLRANIAQTTQYRHRAETLRDITDEDGTMIYVSKEWCFLPTLTMFGVANRGSARRWSNGNIQIAIDTGMYIDGDGEQMFGSSVEADLNGDYVCYEEETDNVDLIENSWELGNRRLQFTVNPECADAEDNDYTNFYIPTSTPAISKTDSNDGTIPNRIGCFYLPKADGTSTTSQLGVTSPYNYYPATYTFALVPFRTTETDNVAAELVSEPLLGYGITAYE